ncbi:nuclear transport factor 2 family protein [Alkalibacillus salilacus]|uniref:SnoaL-like domain-containing protein n=1 Tax=Alkalibacillus salilacus TaxID=284582 RepID=A0ABT9VFF9_9BACI|nr:nuclear transport factor 2 family protein [Alkalibacillus salilacus]MDQ0159689.1 hypothetical protein [Alkalibacillus salilacus]
MNIVCEESCGNAPRKALLRDFSIALTSGDVDSFQEFAIDDLEWQYVGGDKIVGLDQLRHTIQSKGEDNIQELRLENIITHGKTAAVDGVIHYENETYMFCDVYEFNRADKNGKIKKVKSYLIPVPS